MDQETAEKELAEITIIRDHEIHSVDLRSIWLTAWGFEILYAMKLGTECSETDFQKVKVTVAELGYNTQIIESDELVFSTTMSKPLREYIWKLAETNKL